MGGFRGRWARIWHWLRPPIYLVFRTTTTHVICGSFQWKVCQINPISVCGGFSKSLNTNMTLATSPDIPGAQDDDCPRHLLEFSRKYLNHQFNICIRGVFEVAEHEYDIAYVPWCTWCSGQRLPTSFAGVFNKMFVKLIQYLYSGAFEVAEHEYVIGYVPRYT